MVGAFRFTETGGPEVLQWVDVPLDPPGAGEIQVRHDAVGLNYIDIYHRSGVYPVDLPSGIGLEAAGTVTAVGPGVTGLAPGDTVATGVGPLGACCEARNMPADKAVRLPDGVAPDTSAAVMLQGLTVQYLIRQTFPVRAGMTVLWHAVAGGVGLLACQWLRHLGVTVIGTAGSAEKAALARAHGCSHVILYRSEDIASRVREITAGQGVPVVYDGVGRDTFAASLDCLSPRGMMVSFGNASGTVPPFSPGLLSAKGSLFLTRPTLGHYTADRAALESMAGELLGLVADGTLKVVIGQTFPLRDTPAAHAALEARTTTGATVLLP